MLNNEVVQTILALVDVVQDETKTAKERRTALAHIVQLKGDTSGGGSVDAIPESDLSHVARWMAPWPDRTIAGWFSEYGDSYSMAQARAIIENIKLRTIAGDVSKSMSDRIEAARKWREGLPATSYWLQYKEYELPEHIASTKWPDHQRL